MPSKYYLVNFPKIWKWDLEPFIGRDVETMTEEETDDAFVRSLAHFAFARQNSKKLMLHFLEHHFKKTKTSKLDFLKHTESLVRANERKFTPQLSLGYIYDWLESRRSEIQTSLKDSGARGARKADPDFPSVFVDEKKMVSIMSQLTSKGFLDETGTWAMPKIDLIGLIRVLQEKGIVKKRQSKAQLGRVFSKEFNCEMAERSFGSDLKNDRLDFWLKELVF